MDGEDNVTVDPAMDLYRAVQGVALEERDVTDVDLEQVTSPEDVREEEEAVEAEEKPAEQESEGFIELKSDDGKVEKIAIEDAIAAVREQRELEGKVDAIISIAEQRAGMHTAQRMQEADRMLTEMANILQTWSVALQQMAPREPSAEMLNPNSKDYDPDGYHRQMAALTQVRNAFGDISQRLQMVQQQQQQVQEQRHNAMLDVEMERLARADPSWRTNAEAKSNELRAGLREHYGFDDATLFSVVDHRFFLAAQDALAYRKMMKDGAATKDKVAAIVKANKQNGAATRAAPNRGGKESQPYRDRAPDGRFVKDSVKALSDGPYTSEKGVNFFLGQIRAGKI
jgi:hypothetical protein